MTKDRFIGCLMGLAIGDGLGAPVEGLDARLIHSQFGRAIDYVSNPPVEILHYTDDTQMTLGVAETLLKYGAIDEDGLAKAFADNYDLKRGYGSGARRLINVILRGGDWRTYRDEMFAGGSYGNGAAMRVAPVVLRYLFQPDQLRPQVEASARVTHTHPLGIEGAQLVATAIAYALTHDELDTDEFLKELHESAVTDEFRWQLKTARELPIEDACYHFGNGLEAHRSVTTAILCFALHPDSYLDTVATAIGRGGDTDTLAAMAGAMSGALLGTSAIPEALQTRFEEQDKGLAYIVDLAGKLWDAAKGEPA